MLFFILRLKYHMLHILRIANPNVGNGDLADAFGRYMYNVESHRSWPLILREIKRQKKKGHDFEEVSAIAFKCLRDPLVFKYRDRLDAPVEIWIDKALLEYGIGTCDSPFKPDSL